MRILLLNPGTIESAPDAGVGLVSKWRHSDTTKLYELKRLIETQLSAFLPSYQLGEVHLKTKGSELIISIQVDNMLFSYITKDDTLKLYELKN